MFKAVCLRVQNKPDWNCVEALFPTLYLPYCWVGSVLDNSLNGTHPRAEGRLSSKRKRSVRNGPIVRWDEWAAANPHFVPKRDEGGTGRVANSRGGGLLLCGRVAAFYLLNTSTPRVGTLDKFAIENDTSSGKNIFFRHGSHEIYLFSLLNNTYVIFSVILTFSNFKLPFFSSTNFRYVM